MKRRKTSTPIALPKPGEVYSMSGVEVLVISTDYHCDMWGDFWTVKVLTGGHVKELSWYPSHHWEWCWGVGNMEIGS